MLSDEIEHDPETTGPTLTVAGSAAAATRQASARGELASGARLGRFEVREVLGRGGMGIVFRAHDGMLARDVALKVLDQDTSDSSLRLRLQREARAMAQLSHPNLVTVYEAGLEGEHFFIAMELVRGTTLSRWLKVQKRSWREVVTVLIAAGRGLAAVHAAGIIHRDFKPSNVLIREDGVPQVTDFGIAMMSGVTGTEPSGGSQPRALQLTETGVAMGTPRYMSPEQHRSEPVDPKADQFSFAVTLAEAVLGTAPFAGESYPELVAQVLNGEPHLPAGNAPNALRRLLRRALSRRPGDRFESMDELLEELEALVRPRRRRWIAAVAALVATMGIAAVVFATRRSDGPEPAAPPPAKPEKITEKRPVASPPVAAPAAPVIPTPSSTPDAGVTRKVRTEPQRTRRSTRRARRRGRRINWRHRKITCIRRHATKSCKKCCTIPGDVMKPYPDCGCYFDGDKWDREHGRR